tara:strand:+ start:179 stop:460 length:282 start_codon:yes stop_codon:yes gene_type:complete
MNTKIKVYRIEWKWSDNSDDSSPPTLVAVGADPYLVWGDEDEWSDNQLGFDNDIHYWFEDMDELKAHCVNDGEGEWNIESYEFDYDDDLANIN